MILSDVGLSTIAEVLELSKGESVKIKGQVTHSLRPRKLWKGISQFIVLKDETETIGCNVSCDSIDNGYELGESLVVVGERGEYPEKDKRTGQLTGGVVKNINGYVESSFIDANEDMKETEPEVETVDNKPKEKPVAIKQEKYTSETYWKDKFLLDVERQESYKANNETIIRECAIKAVTELASRGGSFITSEQEYYAWADKIVDWIKDEEDFKLKTEANLIISGLSPLKKAEIIDWINNVRIGTDIEEDDDFLIKLNVQTLPAQTVKELRETVDTMMKYFLVSPKVNK